MNISTNSAATGIIWMVLATAAIVGMDAIAKFLLQNYSVIEVVWGRYTAHLFIVVAFNRVRVWDLISSSRIGIQLVRSSLILGASLSLFSALLVIPLATGSAIMFTAPLLVTGLSAPILKEKVGRNRWAAVIIGLIGALIITQPGDGPWHPETLLAFVAACFYALYQITTRALSHSDPPKHTLILTSMVGAITMSILLPYFWTTPTLTHSLLMASMGLLSGIGHYALIQAFTHAEASIITPFGYTSLIWATLFGVLIFKELPDNSTFVGAGLIVVSGMAVFRAERRVRGR